MLFLESGAGQRAPLSFVLMVATEIAGGMGMVVIGAVMRARFDTAPKSLLSSKAAFRKV